MEAAGADLNAPHHVDSHIEVADEKSAGLVRSALEAHGFRVEVVAERAGGWTVWCTKLLVPTEERIVEMERLISELAGPHGGRLGGWGAYPRREA